MESIKQPLISVIVPVYNVENYVNKCLGSIIAQTYKNLEIIVIDDGSTDKSGTIIDKCAEKDKRIIVIHQDNKGVAEARNKGLRMAQGMYIGFVDSDDWIHPQMYEHLYNLLNQGSADISGIEIVKAVKEKEIKHKKHEIIKCFNKEQYLKKFFKIGSQEVIFYIYNKLYRKEIIPEEPFSQYEVGEDVIFTYKVIFNANKIIVSNLSLYFYRQATGITATFNDNYFQLLDVWKEILTHTKKGCPEYKEYAEINLERIRFTLLSEIAISGVNKKEKYKKVVKQLLSELIENKDRLLSANIALTRKIAIYCFCINYELTSFLMHKFLKKRQ